MTENNPRPEAGGEDEHRNLPAVPDDAEVEEMVFDGEVIDETPPTVISATAVRTVITSPHARLAGRHATYVAAGAVVAVRRWHAARTRHERMQRAAEAAGDHETALKWAQHHEQTRHQKHQRRMARVEAVIAVAKAAPWIIGTGLALMVLLGMFLAVGRRRLSDVAWPFVAVAHAVALGVEVASVAWMIATIAVPVAIVLALHHIGRHAGDLAPGWSVAARPDGGDAGIIVTADTVVLALQNIRVPELKRAFKDDWRPAFRLLPVRDGQGYSTVFSLPLGVTPEMVADQRPVFARNLHRAEVEVWPTDAERAGTGVAGECAVWVADRGVLDKPAPEYPLMHEGTADVFKGVPAGVSPRGDAITIPIVGNNFVVGGIMGQGKSNACRVLMLGAALDPLAELWVHVFAYNADFDSYRPRLARYVKGAEDEQITAAMDSLHEMYAEVGRREARLAELGALKVTRRLAETHPDMRPRLVLFSECHELFGHREFGDEATELAVSVIRRARKTALWMGFDTQDARKDAIPPKIVGLVSVNACFAVKTWRANDGFLGDGSFAAGIRATELRPGRDIGRSLVTGVSDAQFELLKWHYIRSDDERGYDEAAEVVARAMRNLAPGTAIAGNSPLPAIEVRDLLEDLAEVLDGPDKVRLADLPARLRKLAPTWTAYRSLTGAELRELLEAEGVRTTNAGNVPRLDPEDLRRVLAQRED